MELHDTPVLVISGPELTALDRQLRDAMRLAYGAPGRVVPRVLLEFVVAVNTAAGSAGSGPERWPAHGAEQGRFRAGVPLGPWAQPATVSVTVAAQAAEVSEGYVRRLVRTGTLDAVRDRPGGAYRVMTDSLAVWMDRRRKEASNPEAA